MIALPKQPRDESGPLRQVIEAAARRSGCSLDALTALAPQHDPYRQDTAANHRDGQWLAVQLESALRQSGKRRLHPRGLHYAIVAAGNVRKPDGEIYRNTEKDWEWLSEKALKAARWLGYVAFEMIADERNSPPIKFRKDRREPYSQIHLGVTLAIPDAADLEPRVALHGFEGRQRYHLVLFGEKSSLLDVVEPLAQRFDADLYQPTGEISDVLLYEMARDGAEDGRPMHVFTLSDADPAGYQMPISIARKLQALRDLQFPGLDFTVRPLALLPEQVGTYGLPSTPLKATEARADSWRRAFGVEQAEIDSLATLQPRVLRQIVVEALTPFYDDTLAERVRAARQSWTEAAQLILEEHSNGPQLVAMRERAVARLADMEEEIEALNQALEQAVPDDLPLPDFEVPEPAVDEDLHGLPLVSSSDDWETATRILKERKRYGALEDLS